MSYKNALLHVNSQTLSPDVHKCTKGDQAGDVFKITQGVVSLTMKTDSFMKQYDP